MCQLALFLELWVSIAIEERAEWEVEGFFCKPCHQEACARRYNQDKRPLTKDRR
jgi:hypothetical protein